MGSRFESGSLRPIPGTLRPARCPDDAGMVPRPPLALLLACASCAGRPRSSVSTRTPPAPAPTSACSIEDTDVTFESSLVLLHELPAHNAMVEHPFIDLARARRVRVDLPVSADDDAPVRVTAETSMLRLVGVAHARALAFHPTRASTFGGILTPLAGHRLRWRGASSGSLRLAPSPPPDLRVRFEPEWRDCDYARLRPVAAFPVADEALARTPGTPFTPGQWSLYDAPRSRSGPRGTLDLQRGAVLRVLEGRSDGWSRVLWTGGDSAVVAWVTRAHLTPPPMGHGSGVGSGLLRESCRRALRCEAELRLTVDDRGRLRDVGHTRPGALVTPGPAYGPVVQVTVCDPDARWADGVPVYAPSAALATCLPVAP